MNDELNRSRRYALGCQYPGVYFNEREAKIMIALLSGKSVSHISKELNCSSRTIDFYVTGMMKMLSCESIIKLVECVKKTDFMKYL